MIGIVENILNGALRNSINNPHITDKVFCVIERRFVKQYWGAYRRNPRINMQIGKHIKQY